MSRKMSGWDIAGLVLGGVACGISIADAAQGVSRAKASLDEERARLRRAEHERAMAKYAHEREMAMYREELRQKRLERLMVERDSLEEMARSIRLVTPSGAARFEKLAADLDREICDVLCGRR